MSRRSTLVDTTGVSMPNSRLPAPCGYITMIASELVGLMTPNPPISSLTAL